MRIALDAMGGDHAPREILLGAVAGLEHLGPEDRLLIYGPRERVAEELRSIGLSDARVESIHCTQTIDMGDTPVDALRQKRDSSIVRMASDAGKGQLDALISAGNTGAFAAACQFKIGPMPGVSRPGIAVALPTFHGPVIVCDVGANVTPKPHHLYEYARMCTVYAQAVLGVQQTHVGIITIGEEEAKGTPLVKEARALLKADSSIDFIGNVEGRDIFAGTGNVFICDGFTGNVILKLTEGLAEGLFKTIFREIGQEDPDLARQWQPVVERIWKRHDFADYGGAPLLGLNNVAIICHGRSDRRAIGNAIRVAADAHRKGVNATIAARMAGGQEGAA